MKITVTFKRNYSDKNCVGAYVADVDYEVDPPVEDSCNCPGHPAILRIERAVIMWREVEEIGTNELFNEIGWQVGQEVGEEVSADKELFEEIYTQIKEEAFARAR